MALYKPGQSGNPAGKKKGTKHESTRLREMFRTRSTELFNTAINLALDGDVAMIRLCIDKILPSMKPVTETIEAPLSSEGTLAEQAATLYRQAASGEVSLDVAVQLMNVLQGRIKIDEFSTIEARLAALEDGSK